MRILGISALYHDAAACLLEDGVIVAAAQEERFTRIKNDAAIPKRAVSYCLAEAGVALEDVDAIAFYDKPFLKFERLLETYLATAPQSFGAFLRAMPQWLGHKLWMPALLRREIGWKGKIMYAEHHVSHAASAFYPSPFEHAAVITLDGVGEWTTTAWGVGSGRELELREELRFPHSLGLLYSAFTSYLGFDINEGEGKVMGLAPYGEPHFASTIKENLIDIKDDGTFLLDMRYFDFLTGDRMTNRAFDALFGGLSRKKNEELTQRHKDIAASIQAIAEEVVLKLARSIRARSGEKNLCLAGGVALNCVANGRIMQEEIFERVWVQPAAGDAGGAIGAAFAAWHGHFGKPRPAGAHDAQRTSLLGPSFGHDEIARAAASSGFAHAHYSAAAADSEIARLVDEGKIIGLFRGRMEFGPRALGNRSIIADARRADMRGRINREVKFREDFRPFAPAVLAERAVDYFGLDTPSPYMLFAVPVRAERRAEIPSVTHVNGTARVQTVSAREHSRFHALLAAFERRTGCPILINTSLNVRGEPIACTPEDALRCFRQSGLDALVLEDVILRKK